MSILKSLGIVEDVQEIPIGSGEPKKAKVKVEADPALPAEKVANFATVDAIYAAANLSDLSKSIAQVALLKSKLPKNIDDASAKASVLGIMEATGLTKELVLADAESRAKALEDAKTSFGASVDNDVANAEAQISELEKRIAELKEEITTKRNAKADQAAAVDAEESKINETVTFIS